MQKTHTQPIHPAPLWTHTKSATPPGPSTMLDSTKAKELPFHRFWQRIQTP